MEGDAIGTAIDLAQKSGRQVYLAHQVNASNTLMPRGIANQIFSRLPDADIYSKGENINMEGRCLLKPIANINLTVANLVGQKYKGKAYAFRDSKQDRLNYIEAAFRELINKSEKN